MERSTRIRRGGALLSGLFLLAACGGPDPVAPPRATAVRLEGREVVWNSTRASRGAVRFGRHSGRYDRVAYPPQAQRLDLAFVTAHRVRLLSPAQYDSVYLQVIDQAGDGTDAASGEFGFRVDAPSPGGLLRWTMLDVGFGDSHFLETPSGTRVLLDAGERRDAANVEAFLADLGVARLDVVAFSHVHEDHIGGLVGSWGDAQDGVLGTVEVGTLLDGAPWSAPRSAYGELLALAATRGVSRVTVASGASDATTPALAWDPAVRATVLRVGGGKALGGATESDWLNDDSMVLRLAYGDVAWVLGGDAESPAERALLDARAPLASTALKVHHHGAADAAEPGYLAAVDPRVAMIPIASVEATPGSLPSGVTLERLRARGADIYANDRAEALGIGVSTTRGWNVSLVTDGAGVEVRMEPSRSVHFPTDRATIPRAGSGVEP